MTLCRFICAWLFATLLAAAAVPTDLPSGLVYTNYYLTKGTNHWNLHVVRLDRRSARWEFALADERNPVTGLSTLRELIEEYQPGLGMPDAAINGDFFQRRGFAPGDPRGLMMRDREILSAPTGGAVFWLNAGGDFHTGYVTSRFNVAWPNGRGEPLGLNEELRLGRAVIYTRAIGPTTPPATRSFGRELVLEPAGPGPWLPLRPGVTLTARVVAVQDTGETPLGPNSLVLAVSTNRLGTRPQGLPMPQPGMVLKISTCMAPAMQDATLAIGGGPVLLAHGRTKIFNRKPPRKNLPYSIVAWYERHPRSAIGWNEDYFYLVVVDGRIPELSLGMKLSELAAFMKSRLGCTEAMNFDGGGSATLWCGGQVVNTPSDGEERPVANALFLFRR
jgi:hypothetical protein